jgi:hypothetical protein
MSNTYYVTAVIPAADRDAVEAALAPYLLSPNNPGVYTFSIPLSTTGTGEPTYYGVCAAVPDSTGLYAAIGSLAAAFPGSSYAQTLWTDFVLATNWTAWLAGLGLAVISD